MRKRRCLRKQRRAGSVAWVPYGSRACGGRTRRRRLGSCVRALLTGFTKWRSWSKGELSRAPRGGRIGSGRSIRSRSAGALRRQRDVRGRCGSVKAPPAWSRDKRHARGVRHPRRELHQCGASVADATAGESPSANGGDPGNANLSWAHRQPGGGDAGRAPKTCRLKLAPANSSATVPCPPRANGWARGPAPRPRR